ncbi:hypothetical protein GGX14DRAFT_354309, partial [Mycena pura]
MNGPKAKSIYDSSNKWKDVYRMLWDNSIGIMVLTETHLNAGQANEINESFMKDRVKIFNSPFPDNPAAKGIAIVLNPQKTNIKGVGIHYLIPGKAVLAVLPWHGKKTLTVLGVYAPTESPRENREFWDTLSNLWMTTDLPVPDIMVGDFNLV